MMDCVPHAVMIASSGGGGSDVTKGVTVFLIAVLMLLVVVGVIFYFDYKSMQESMYLLIYYNPEGNVLKWEQKAGALCREKDNGFDRPIHVWIDSKDNYGNEVKTYLFPQYSVEVVTIRKGGDIEKTKALHGITEKGE